MMKNNDRTIGEWIQYYIKEARKEKNAAKLYYYENLSLNIIAFNTYELFINSWAGKGWYSKEFNKIKQIADSNNKRFNDIGEWKTI